MKRGLVRGQHVSGGKVGLAWRKRREPTAAEAALWNELRANRLDGMHFRRQQVLAGFIVDFFCNAAGLAIEVDGSVHEKQTDYDGLRDLTLGQYGIRVLRVTNDDVLHALPIVLTRIREAAHHQSVEPPPR